MFAVKEINQMEREMCAYLQWDLNIQGDEVVEFESRIREDHGFQAFAASSPAPASMFMPAVNADPTPGRTRNRSQPVPQIHKMLRQQVVESQASFPSRLASAHQPHTGATSSQPPQFASASSSLASSPLSDGLKTPSVVSVIPAPLGPTKSDVSHTLKSEA